MFTSVQVTFMSPLLVLEIVWFSDPGVCVKYEGERGGEKHAEKVRVDLTAEGAMQRAAVEAPRSIFVWPRKAKK